VIAPAEDPGVDVIGVETEANLERVEANRLSGLGRHEDHGLAAPVEGRVAGSEDAVVRVPEDVAAVDDAGDGCDIGKREHDGLLSERGSDDVETLEESQDAAHETPEGEGDARDRASDEETSLILFAEYALCEVAGFPFGLGHFRSLDPGCLWKVSDPGSEESDEFIGRHRQLGAQPLVSRLFVEDILCPHLAAAVGRPQKSDTLLVRRSVHALTTFNPDPVSHFRLREREGRTTRHDLIIRWVGKGKGIWERF
jgi:hypothetical protein